ncbi:BrxA/BrxB family bacilliredoxin [Bacillus massiliigorillae]|uniref:BrxA/BrxB family bacilliredoxin n=1 Tax=Bacillus massiliigorillae TaxID=1243664 RepID=UPI00039E1FF1|nr:BrxA/BrxB family bacilliredoxin [Bacillus massiliigorillae]
MSNAYEQYMKQVSQPMRDELLNAGFNELTTAEQVEQYMEGAEGYTFVVINSVCGCAAGLARPAATTAIAESTNKPNAITVFAGQDKEATAKMREYMADYVPSSPSMALFKGKECVHFIAREEIEGHSVEEILANIQQSFADYIA